MAGEMTNFFFKEFNFLLEWGYELKKREVYGRGEQIIIYHNKKLGIRIEFYITDHLAVTISRSKLFSYKEIVLDRETYLLFGNEDINRYFIMPFGIQKNAVFMKEKLSGLLNGKGWDKIKNSPWITFG